MTNSYVVQRILSHYPHLEPQTVAQRLRHSSFVHVRKRYLYFEVPKAACTQMKELLRQQEAAPPIQLFVGTLMETRREMFVHARENVPLPSLLDLDDTTQKEVLESGAFFRFAIVRNPYSRVVSAWKNKVVPCEPGAERLYVDIKGRLPGMHAKELITFDEFVTYLDKIDLSASDPHWRRQGDHLFLDALSFSHVGKVENMSATMDRFQQHLGLAEPLMSGRKNVSAPVGLATYDETLAAKVYSLYQGDFERLGYHRDSWREGQVAVSATPQKAVIPEARFYDEIIERNLIISGLYAERAQLQADLKRVSRLHLLPLVNGLASIRRGAVALASRIRNGFRATRGGQSVTH